MSARTARLFLVLALSAAAGGAVTGCGSEQGSGRGAQSRVFGPSPVAEARARQVADAWDGSEAARAWRKGYYPTEEGVQLPEDAFHDAADKQAYGNHNFTLHGRLPAAPRKDGRVKWESGDSLTLPLMEAQEAYEAVAHGSDDGPRLIVTGAKLGEMTLATSRGPATVPAWLFTLDGYDTPLKQAAVHPFKPSTPPVEPVAQGPSDTLQPLPRLVGTAGDGRSVTVIADHGACDDGPAVDVLETDGSVVLSASVVGTKEGPCTDQALREMVTVNLDRPLGDRVLLDAFTGRPVPYGRP
ncbi:hypothetical protein [Streptomyces carpinensis]|uniref:Lipoprotein n=1 Tax=Streptomyces carpinensis TaxID=66369 RepID=A0ABV1VYZ5_9ACTN|nr:hypothetical protein [Streptomyces carpinensis]